MQDAAPTASATATAAPGTGPRIVYERPDSGLGKGMLAVPAWAVIAIGLAAIAGIVAFFVARHRRERAPDSSVAPQSVPPSSRR
jgi:hypothetical protein